MFSARAAVKGSLKPRPSFVHFGRDSPMTHEESAQEKSVDGKEQVSQAAGDSRGYVGEQNVTVLRLFRCLVAYSRRSSSIYFSFAAVRKLEF